METTSRPQERENPPPTNSPNSNSSSSNGGVHIQTPPLSPTPKPATPRSADQSNPYPTTFIQADPTTFKHVVQLLTGSKPPPPPPSDPPPPSSSRGSIPPIKTGQKKQSSFKLYERRNNLRNGLMISPVTDKLGRNSGGFSPPKAELLSPSILDFPSLVLSPVTPLIEDPFDKSSSSPSMRNPSLEEEKAIAEKGFYFHPSPRKAPVGSDPLLLPLFPVTSPRVSGSS